MKKVVISLFFSVGLVLSSCNKQTSTEPQDSSKSPVDAQGTHETEQETKSGKETNPELFARLAVQEDPMCGMSFTEYPIADTFKTKDGKVYGFCSPHCKDEFAKHQATN